MSESSRLGADALLRAAGDPVRWQLLQVLAGGEPLTVRRLAQWVGRDEDGISKHLRVLREAGLVKIAQPEGEDRRKLFHVLAVPGVADGTGQVAADFGPVVLRFPRR